MCGQSATSSSSWHCEVLPTKVSQQMLSINKKEVPSFLHATAFFRALDEGDDQSFEVPKHCYKENGTLNTKADVAMLIETIRFWGIGGTPKELVAYALKNGYFHCRPLFKDVQLELRYLELLFTLQITNQQQRMSVAMLFGNQVIVQYLHENGHTWCNKSMKFAAVNGHLACMKYAHTNGCSWDKNTMHFIAQRGNLECMKYAHENGCEWTRYTLACIASSGNVDCFKYAVAHGCVDDVRELHVCIVESLYRVAVYWHGACANAAHKGHLEMLKYLRTHNLSEWDSNTCAAAAAAGQLECLKFAHENGCAWNANTTALAARYWHFHCLDYALQHGCAYDTRTIFYVFTASHPDAYRLLREQCQGNTMLTLECSFLCVLLAVIWMLIWVFQPVVIVTRLISTAMIYYTYFGVCNSMLIYAEELLAWYCRLVKAYKARKQV